MWRYGSYVPYRHHGRYRHYVCYHNKKLWHPSAIAARPGGRCSWNSLYSGIFYKIPECYLTDIMDVTDIMTLRTLQTLQTLRMLQTLQELRTLRMSQGGRYGCNRHYGRCRSYGRYTYRYYRRHCLTYGLLSLSDCHCACDDV